MITLYTTQISKWRKLKDEDIDLIDITAKSGISCFAPDFDLVLKYKNNEISEELYTHFYITKMRWSFKEHKKEWDKLIVKPKIAFACYCKPDTFCHRLIFKDIFKRYLESKEIKYKDNGEFK